MREGSIRSALWMALICLTVGGGCAQSREYVFLSHQPILGGQRSVRQAPTRLSIPTFTDVRKGVAPNVLGYLDQSAGAEAGVVVLAEHASLAEAMTQEVVSLYRLHGFEVFPDSAGTEAHGRLEGELRGEIVTFVVNTTKGAPLGKVEGEGALVLQLWHPEQGNLLWTATLKASAERDYQISLTRARSATVNDIYGQLLRGVERHIPHVQERIEKLYRTGR